MSIPALVTAAEGYFGYKGAKDAAKAQRDAAAQQAAMAAQAQAEQMKYLREADAAERAMQEKAIAIQQDMFNRQLDEQGAGLNKSIAAALQQAQMGQAGNLAAGQAGMNQQLGLMQMMLQENLPQMQARQAALQAMPYLSALMGLPSYAVPEYQMPNPQALQTDLASLYNQQLSQLQNPQAAGAAGAPGSMGVGQPMNTAQPLTPMSVDLSQILQKSPGFQFQQQEGEKSINRALAARGLLGSSQAIGDLGKFNQRLMADEYSNIFNRLSSMLNVGLGGQPSQMGQFGPSLAASSNQLASMPQANLSSLYNQAAQGRAAAYGAQGPQMANLYTGIGSARAQNMGDMGALSTFALPYAQNAMTPVQAPNPWTAGLNTFKDIYAIYQDSQKKKPGV